MFQIYRPMVKALRHRKDDAVLEASASHWPALSRRGNSRSIDTPHGFAQPKAADDRRIPGDRHSWIKVEGREAHGFAGLWKVGRDHDRVFACCTA